MVSCRACGLAAPDDARFCPTCGNALRPAAPGDAPAQAPPPQPSPWGFPPAPEQPQAPPQGPGPWSGPPSPGHPGPYVPPPPMQGPGVKARPLGITVLAILGLVLGALAALFGLLLAVAGPAILADPAAQQELAEQLPPGSEGLVGPVVAVAGLVLLVLGVAWAATGYGLYHGRPWAWTLALVLVALDAVGGVASLATGDGSGVLTLLLAGFLLWYLTRDGVKAWCGRVAQHEPGLPGYVPPPPMPPP